MAYVPGVAMRCAARLYPGAAKSDPKDAQVLADFARRNVDRLEPIAAVGTLLAHLRILNGRDTALAKDAHRVLCRLQDALMGISPALGRAIGSELVSRAGMRDLLEKWPTAAADNSPRSTLSTTRSFSSELFFEAFAILISLRQTQTADCARNDDTGQGGLKPGGTGVGSGVGSGVGHSLPPPHGRFGLGGLKPGGTGVGSGVGSGVGHSLPPPHGRFGLGGLKPGGTGVGAGVGAGAGVGVGVGTQPPTGPTTMPAAAQISAWVMQPNSQLGWPPPGQWGCSISMS